MANSIGNGGFNIPNHSSKVGFHKPAASAPQEQAQQLPGDVSDVNFSFRTPAAAPKAETFVQSKAAPTESAPSKAFTAPSNIANYGPIMDLSVGEVGMNLLGPSKSPGATAGINGIQECVARGTLLGLSGREY